MPNKKLEDLCVLIVDDEPSVTRLLKTLLSDMQVTQVFTAEDGREALNFLGEMGLGIDVIICDWNMPNMTGLDLLKQVRTVDNDVRFVMMTGRGDLDSVKVARDHGIDSYLRKPFSPEQLQKKLQTSCRGLPTTHQQTARLVG
jgi:YesN/AraC family two-component response regulator